eukprot:TRINITY_DN6_c0_g1_i1.p1 TRINITY_DN6_c0_g1~~TRINITY_DN6_c0_g1_i1.p1  ORF type:complete len:733 (-),score=273.09 TRINITY_DN6_c0_g1_i1:118-2316(-)
MQLHGISLRCFAVAVAVACVSTPAVASRSSPLGKVLALLKDLSAKVTNDGEVEEKVYKKYFAYCDDVTTQKRFEIKTASAQKEKLESKISQLTSDIEVSVTKIADLAKEIASGSKELKDATAIRDKENANFQENEKELMEVVDTLGKAIGILEKELSKNPAFAQVAGKNLAGVVQSLTAVVEASALTIEDKQQLMQLVQTHSKSSASSDDSEEDEDSDEDDSEQPAYEAKSGSIVEVLQDLQEKAETQLDELRRAEKTAKQNFALLKKSLEDKLAADTKEMDDEKVEKGKAQEAKATAEGDLTVTVADLKAATEALEEAKAECIQVAADHEGSIKSRKAELNTIEEAITTLEATTGGAAQQTYSFVQVAAKESRGKAAQRVDLSHSTVVALVKQMAEQSGSADLAQLASRIFAVSRYSAASGEDPFTKVKGLINDMILKLEKEKEAEQTEKQYCDAEMKKTTSKKGELDDDIADLTAKIDQALARSAELKQQVNDIQEDLRYLAKEQADADSIRAEEKAAYEQSKADLEEGLGGVRKALSVLREYYAAGDSGDAALLQDNSAFSDYMEQPAKPVSHQASDAGGGVIGVLEVIESDFATNLAKLETEEATAQDAYEKTTQENKVVKAQKEQDVKYKTQEFTGLDKTISELSTDRETAATELGAVEEYFAKLKERCVAKPDTYEVRKKKREAEIAGLKEALTTLKGEAALAQQAVQAKKRAGAKRSMRGGHQLQ